MQSKMGTGSESHPYLGTTGRSGLFRGVALFAAIFILALLPAVVAQNEPITSLYDDAIRALGEGLPRVAVYKFKNLSASESRARRA